MYMLVFKPVASAQPANIVNIKPFSKSYAAFEGKIIRHINVMTLDPFGYSVADTHVAFQNIVSKAGNYLHIKTQRATIRNLLLIRPNQLFDSLLVKESERLVRSSGFVRDVSFKVVFSSGKQDSVDIYIRESDNWSIEPNGSYSGSQISYQLKDKNFLGFGHEFDNSYTKFRPSGEHVYYGSYFIPNIRNTYINTTLHYGTEVPGDFTKSMAFDRPFFSPFAKWAAGVNISQVLHLGYIYGNDSILMLQRFKYSTQDFWAGNAMQIFKGNTENIRTTTFISLLRYLRIRYIEKPFQQFDSLHIYSNEDFYLAGFGISTRKYIQDKFIFNFGLTEDVPVGKVYSITAGYQSRSRTGRLYLGARFSLGNYHPWGYLSSDFEYGTFFHGSKTEQGVFTAGINYFSELKEIGKWKFRQFVKPRLTIGINRFSYDSLTIKDGVGIDGFSSSGLTGTNRLLLTLQTQSYAPWNVAGFRFGPYLVYSVGMLGNAVTGFKNSRMYSQIGLGVLIKNDNLVFNVFQFSISYYPEIPGYGQDVLKLNSFKTTDFGLRDFVIEKPGSVVFQ